MKSFIAVILFITFTISAQQVDIKKSTINGEYKLPNIVPALDYEDDLIYKTDASGYIPVMDEEFIEHVRGNTTAKENQILIELFASNSGKLKTSKYQKFLDFPITAIQNGDNVVWIGTMNGLYVFNTVSQELTKHESYGVNGPLSTHISDMKKDSKGTIWFGTPIGLSLLKSDGSWSS